MGVDVVYEQSGNKFRVYESDPTDAIQKRVKQHYVDQHQKQTVQFVQAMHEKYLKFTHGKMTIMECLAKLSGFLDQSDPDVDTPNIFHAYQTAERLREAEPEKPWLHLAGLVHDLGKVMNMWGEEQWAVTGDTYPVGCAPAGSVVYGESSFDGCADRDEPKYNTKLGIYEEHCGLDKLLMTWGHDEYMYQVLTNHGSTLPADALYAIRFHSFYPYHSHGDYKYFANEKDAELLPAILTLNSCDLYSKTDKQPDIAALQPYYQSLIDKYIPGVVAW